MPDTAAAVQGAWDNGADWTPVVKEVARLRARLAEVEGALAEAAEIAGEPSVYVEDRDQIKERLMKAARIRAILSRTEGRTPPTKDPETGCGGPKEACIPCRKPSDHEAHRCTECGVTWCDECSCPAPTHDGGGTPPRNQKEE